MTEGKYAVVTNPEVLGDLGITTEKWGVCVVDGGTATCHLVCRCEISALVSDMPVSPAGHSSVVGLIPYHLEIEALRLIADSAVREQPSEIPEGFIAPGETWKGGLRLMIRDNSLDALFSPRLLDNVGWDAQTLIGISSTPDGSLVSIDPQANGIGLTISGNQAAAPDVLLGGLPLQHNFPDTPWIEPDYEIRGRSLVFATSSLILKPYVPGIAERLMVPLYVQSDRISAFASALPRI